MEVARTFHWSGLAASWCTDHGEVEGLHRGAGGAVSATDHGDFWAMQFCGLVPQIMENS